MNKKYFFLTILIVISGIFYYQMTGYVIPKQEFRVLRVIDGDTLELDSGVRLRLKGINTPERSMDFYEQAKLFLEKIENRNVKIENYGVDKYGRVLAYIFIGGKNVNKEILENGLGTLYYYEKDEYFKEFENAEKFARDNQLGLWKKSSSEGCLKIVEFDYISEGGEKLILNNYCEEMRVIIKDDATHIYRETLPEGKWGKSFDKIWNDAGDTLYIWDEEGLLMFYRY